MAKNSRHTMRKKKNKISGPIIEGVIDLQVGLLPQQAIELLPWMEKSEEKVFFYLLWRSMTSHGDSPCSISELMMGTGLSRQSTLDGKNYCIDRGTVEAVPLIKYQGHIQYVYRLKIIPAPGGMNFIKGSMSRNNGTEENNSIGLMVRPMNSKPNGLMGRPMAVQNRVPDAGNEKPLKRNLNSLRESVVVDSIDQQQQTDSRNQALQTLINEGVYPSLALSAAKKYSLQSIQEYIGVYHQALEKGIAKGGVAFLGAMLKDGWDSKKLAEQVSKADPVNQKARLSKKQERELNAIATNLGIVGPIAEDIIAAFKKNAKMVRSWYYCVMHLEGEEKKHRVARFIKAVREGRPNNRYAGNAKNEVKICENGEEGRAKDYVSGEYAEFIQH
jgi:hypothetical protein